MSANVNPRARLNVKVVAVRLINEYYVTVDLLWTFVIGPFLPPCTHVQPPEQLATVRTVHSR